MNILYSTIPPTLLATLRKPEGPIGKVHGMTTHVRARYSNGVLTPLEPLDLKEGSEVTVSVEEDNGAKAEVQNAGGPLASVLALVQEMENTIPPEEWASLPTDGSRNHKHYLYGHPKEEDRCD